MSLPLKVKISVRDHWDKPEAPIQAAFKQVKDLLGLEVYCEPQWPIIISDLEKVYEDKGQLVQSVIGILHTWLVTIAELMDDSSHDAWSEKVVEKIREFTTRMNLNVDVIEGDRASTEWSDGRKGFVVSVPKVHVYQPAQFAQVFKEQLLECFQDKKQSSKALPIHSTTGDEWADVTEDVIERPSRSAPTKSSASTIDFLPDPNALPKPGTLFAKPPYHLIMNAYSNTKLQIQCSHSPTLDVLSQYLKRWCKINPNLTNKPPAVEIELNQGTCGFGLTYDTLTLFCDNRYSGQFTVSPTLILHLLEGVLGYERVFSDASSWHYRRDAPYKQVRV